MLSVYDIKLYAAAETARKEQEEKRMIETLLEQIKRQEDVRKALSQLRAEIKTEEANRHVRELIGDGSEIVQLLLSEDPKIRKNAAALLGDLEVEAAAEAIYHAYQKEQTLFVRGSLLQALEQTNAYPYLSELRDQYEMLCRREPEEAEKKHVREELHALERIFRSEGLTRRHKFTGWDNQFLILLITNPQYAALTADQLPPCRQKLSSLGVQAIVEDLRPIVKIRTFRELLFPIRLSEKVSMEDGPEALGEAIVKSRLRSVIERSHREPGPFQFRLDLKGGFSLEERSRYLKRAAAVIEEKSDRKLLNAPDEYEFEIRLLPDKEQNIHVFLKMFTIPMDRFSYRRETIAASIQPSAAAMFFELARPYLKEQAQVLDPCCGVGTMLVERDRVLPVRMAYGIDTFGEAVEKARRNTKSAGMQVNFINRDYLDFKHSYPFDEIIANLPVRGKRTKEEQDAFYAGFFKKSEELLAPDGMMILYSNEAGFIKKQLRLHPKFKLYQEYMILEKGQFCLYVIGMQRG